MSKAKPKPVQVFEQYGVLWPEKTHPIQIEMECIKHGGRWASPKGAPCGAGLFHHYREMQSMLWPEDDHHRWSDLILQTILDQRLTVVVGARDTGKTRTASKWALCDYWCFPEETLTLMTSTDMRGLELRVWGDIKELFNRARERFPFLLGNVVDAKKGVFTDDLGGDDEARDMRKGIIGVPCIGSTGDFLGMALKNFAGIKQKRRRLAGDELQFIPVEYLKVLDALDKGDFKGVFLGNPIANNGKALDKVSEPVSGWSALGEVTKTKTWPNKYGGVTINLVGTDSPNFDTATNNQFPYLIDESDANKVAARPGGKKSIEWWSLIMGVRKAGVVSDRVLDMDLLDSCGAFKDCIWSSEPTLRIYGVDAGYGGDTCVASYIECGVEVGGQNVIKFGEQEVVPVEIGTAISTEDQIANFCKTRCAILGVPDSNVFIEAGMRATLAVSFSRIMSAAINAINFGGPATQRPVSNDLFVFDEKTQERRLKTCYEHYSKFVTELAFSVRALVESRQARNFPRQAAEEFEKRAWSFVYGDRYELETKDKYKLRNSGESPNFSDSEMIAVEGARRLGFVIERMPDSNQLKPEDDWLERELRVERQQMKKRELQYL